MLVLIAVNTIKASDTKTESADKTSIIACALPLFTSCAYSVDASAKTVRGKEYAHHVTLNFFIDFLKSAGLETCLIKKYTRLKHHSKLAHKFRSEQDPNSNWSYYIKCEITSTSLVGGLCLTFLMRKRLEPVPLRRHHQFNYLINFNSSSFYVPVTGRGTAKEKRVFWLRCQKSLLWHPMLS